MHLLLLTPHGLLSYYTVQYDYVLMSMEVGEASHDGPIWNYYCLSKTQTDITEKQQLARRSNEKKNTIGAFDL